MSLNDPRLAAYLVAADCSHRNTVIYNADIGLDGLSWHTF